MQTEMRAAPNAKCRSNELTGRKVLIWFLAFFAVVGAVNAIMVRAAVSTFGGVETDSSYKAGLAFAGDVEAARAQDARHWQVRAHISPVKDGTSTVDVAVRDASDRPVTGLDAIVKLEHPTDRRLDHVLILREDAPGHFSGAASVAVGQRELVIDLMRSGERMFRSKNRIVLK